MRIKLIEIRNFRRLREVRIDLEEQSTLFVGANNSGKTSAVQALCRFLKQEENLDFGDLSLACHAGLNKLGPSWCSEEEAEGPDWPDVWPELDVWIEVEDADLHRIEKLIPTLAWNGEPIGVRLRFEPRNPDELRAEYAATRARVAELGAADGEGDKASAFSLWPKSVCDFLEKKVAAQFEVKAYTLDASADAEETANGVPRHQKLLPGSVPLHPPGNPLRKLLRVDDISASRGFGVAETRAGGEERAAAYGGGTRLSAEMRGFYDRHINPEKDPTPADVEALRRFHDAHRVFGKALSDAFGPALEQLAGVGYPGVSNPELRLEPRFRPSSGLNHETAIRYAVPGAEPEQKLTLPERSNGLGYQNLIYLMFRLFGAREARMGSGKAGGVPAGSDPPDPPPPMHLVLVEEPEAHLHTQVQNVFLREAYKVLRKHEELGENESLTTQLVVSTHSSHLSQEAAFRSIRHFRRRPASEADGGVPDTLVASIAGCFEKEDDERFATRYLSVHHCDLFFADAAILIEGTAERVLVPHLLQQHADLLPLRSVYLTWLEVGGSHAHRLAPLLERIGLLTLIITDVDTMEAATEKAAMPVRGLSLRSRNATLKTWLPKLQKYDDLLDVGDAQLVSAPGSASAVRVCYQRPILVNELEYLASTFEDALLYSNLQFFKDASLSGLGKTLAAYAKASVVPEKLVPKVHKTLRGTRGKAAFALDLLVHPDADDLRLPAYIEDGLQWLVGRLQNKELVETGKPGAVLAS